MSFILYFYPATLPLPPIPPPPQECAPGPAVPPRINLHMLNTIPMPGVDLASRRSAAYQDLEEDFEPQFLRQTPSGTIYIPQGIHGYHYSNSKEKALWSPFRAS